MPVTVVGDNTYGKPVGQYGFRFCDKIAVPGRLLDPQRAPTRATTSAGSAPDCAAPDDLAYLLGDPREASLGEALHFAVTGECSAGARGSARLARVPPRDAAATGRERLPAADRRLLVGRGRLTRVVAERRVRPVVPSSPKKLGRFPCRCRVLWQRRFT